ncbi:MAG TPA: SLBB domain-containing protein [Mucilaginibacter sp.]|jgi:protein involved in polysaccharide export with SLBB domain|nr:SLBB domain-containing protein [Mucilaginibacter sp.]
MKKTLYRLCAVIIVLTCVLHKPVFAQELPGNLSSVRVDELSDQQIIQVLQKAGGAGLSDDQVVQMAESRGLPVTEGDKLKKRIQAVREKNSQFSNKADSTISDTGQTKRKLNYQADSDSLRKFQNRDMLTQLVPKVFGSDIFSNSNLTFAPNLKIATPLNYVVGPEDQLNISVYGNSLVNWKLEVSPEGNINIPGVGIMNVAGRTIEQATAAIKSRLVASHYAIGRGTSVQVTLGNIRSIKVILIGELKRPGTYTLPSLATAFNALYAAGGPNVNGSYRQIEIIRGNKVISHLDIYDFLLKGDQSSNIGLQDQDVIRVPTYKVRVEMAGEVKNPALFEVLPGETLDNVLQFAGGFTNEAYTGRIKVLQVSDQQRKISDVFENDYKNYVPLRGDKYVVERVLNRFENRVTIQGAVFRPGDYELDKGLTVSGLIKKAAGLKEDAFTGRGSITRLKPDNSKELISFSISDIIANRSPDIPLEREDSVHIASIFDLRDKYKVTIKGEVRKPGEFAYADSMSVADLVVDAGGFAEGASPKRIEVSRRISNSDPTIKDSQVAMVFSVDLDAHLNLNNAGFRLRPFDIVSVYSLPGYEKQRVVRVAGEVMYPGYYTIQKKNERISDMIKRAGGLTISADIDGSTLKRKNSAILGINKNKTDSAILAQERLARLRHIGLSTSDSSSLSEQQLRNNFIGINLRQIENKPGSTTDLILEDGDELRVPKQQQIVRINGEVLYPSAVVYEGHKSFRSYILNAGGFSSEALRRGAYVVYPNGSVHGTRKFLFFNVHPDVKPGSEIFVPKKPYRPPLSPAEFLGITSGVASIGAIIIGILTLTKK